MVSLPGVGNQLGRFRLERKLGRGGMGMVYLARDTVLDISVVLKVLLPSMTKGADIDRFQRELLVARRITHPGICRLYDIHEENDFHFISMEYVEGDPLNDLIKSQGMLPPRRAAMLVGEVCVAMAAAHEHDIVHRDLKPANIIVRPGDKISVLDFGLSKALDLASITQTNVRVGTSQYMSPEVIDGREAAPQSDIYSLGVILYESLTGRLPFQGASVVEIGNAIKSGNSVPPRRFNPGITASLQGVIARAMKINPKQRFQSMSEFRAALREATADHQDETASPSPDPFLSTPNPDDMERSAHEIFRDPTYSEVLQARIRNTTIVFIDMPGVSPAEREAPGPGLMRKLQEQQALLTPEVEKYSGEVIKTVGTASMACFNTADDGVGAAIGIQRAFEAHNSRRETDDRIHVRIGMNSGKSILGSRENFGRAVNVAAQICAQADADQILISEGTRQMLHPDRHPTVYHSSARRAGKKGAVRIYAVPWGPLGPLVEEPTGSGVRRPRLPISSRLSFERPVLLAGLVGLVVTTLVILILAFTSDTDSARAPADQPADANQASPDTPDTVTASLEPGIQPVRPARVDDQPPGTPELVPEEPPEEPENEAEPPPPAEDEVSTPAEAYSALKRQYRGLRASLAKSMRKKGVIPGDHARLDAERRRMESLWSRAKYREALQAARRAQSAIRAIEVDQVFVRSKLTRYNKMFDDKSRGKNRKRLEDLSRQIFDAMDANDFKRANRLLNQGMVLLGAA